MQYWSQNERQFREQTSVEFLTDVDEILEADLMRAQSLERRKQMTIRRWFKQPQLYQVLPQSLHE